MIYFFNFYVTLIIFNLNKENYLTLYLLLNLLIQKRDRKAHCPRFPKQKDEGWFAVLAEVETKDLITMKRVSYIGGSNSFQLAFYSPPETGRAPVI